MFLFCCANSREEKESPNDSFAITGVDTKLKDWSKVLIHFISVEQKLNLKQTPCLTIFEQVLKASHLSEVPKKSIVSIYKNLDGPNQQSIKSFLA